MKVSKDDIDKVLALFDKEDIDYINMDYLISNGIIEITEEKKEDKGLVLKLGGNDAR